MTKGQWQKMKEKDERQKWNGKSSVAKVQWQKVNGKRSMTKDDRKKRMANGEGKMSKS